MTDSSGEEKKIIIDEDWKSQVEAEKAAAEAGHGDDTAAASDGARGPSDVPLPPADFTTIVSMLATQAMISLGTLPNPINGKAETNLSQAKHAIDLIEVLEGKTKGNRTPQEDDMLENLLHEARMAFVAVQSAPFPGSAGPGAGDSSD